MLSLGQRDAELAIWLGHHADLHWRGAANTEPQRGNGTTAFNDDAPTRHLFVAGRLGRQHCCQEKTREQTGNHPASLPAAEPHENPSLSGEVELGPRPIDGVSTSAAAVREKSRSPLPYGDSLRMAVNAALSDVLQADNITGIYARTDIERGVFKAPANAVVVGARTVFTKPKPLWKYINVRRFFLFLDESIDEGTQWVVFEANNERSIPDEAVPQRRAEGNEAGRGVLCESGWRHDDAGRHRSRTSHLLCGRRAG